MDMVYLWTGGPSLPALSPAQGHWGPSRQKGSFEKCVDLLHGLLSKSWSLSFWRLLETIFRWRVIMQRSVCVVHVCLQASALQRKGKGQTTCLGNCSHSYFYYARFLFPHILKTSGEVGRTLGIHNMQQPCGLWWAWSCLGIFGYYSMVSMSGRYKD